MGSRQMGFLILNFKIRQLPHKKQPRKSKQHYGPAPLDVEDHENELLANLKTYKGEQLGPREKGQEREKLLCPVCPFKPDMSE